MSSPRRALAIAVATVLVLAGGAFAVDSVSASRVEADLSHRIRPATPGVPAPAVTIGGAPTGRWTGPDGDVLSSVTIRAEGVERPAFGAVTVEASATDVSGVRDPGAPLAAGELTVEVQVTGDALGRALGMDQTRLGAADDPSLAGGLEHRARVSGTADGAEISTFVDLVVDERGAHLVPVAPATGPAGVEDQDRNLALGRTALTLPEDLLPLGMDVETLGVRGGTLVAAGTAGPGPTPLGDLARSDH